MNACKRVVSEIASIPSTYFMTTTSNPKHHPQSPLQAAALARKLVEAEIISLAWSDQDFREQLTADPEAALNNAHLDIPDGFRVIVENEPADEIHIVLPPKPNISEELEEEELSTIAGGSPALISGKNCRMADIATKDFKKGGVEGISGGVIASFSLAFGSMVGLSWCWN